MGRNRSEYQQKVSKIKSFIKRFNKIVLLNSLLGYLYQPVNNEIDQFKKTPWVILLLIKWTFIQKKKTIKNEQYLTQNNINTLLKMSHDLSRMIKMPSEYSHHILFFRNIAYQQFIYQQRLSIPEMSRQALLFEANDSYNQKFYELFDIKIKTFIELSFVIVSHFLSDIEYSINLNWFSPLFNKYDKATISNFLKAISVNVEDLETKLNVTNKSKGGNQEYFEQTPFVQFPLIFNGNRYTCINPYIMYRCMEYFIYDSLKDYDAQWFVNSFGNHFEKYLHLGLDYSQVSYFTEDQMVSSLTQGVKVVDYIISEEGCNCFIDAKAVEMSYLGKITDSLEIIQNKVKNSAIKAINQAISLNEYIDKNNGENEGLPKFNSVSYLLVVTYKELYLGNGKTFYDAIASSKIDEIYNLYQDSSIIPLENIFFITIDSFDQLMSLIKNNECSINTILQHAIKNDSDKKTMKFDFSQHISSFSSNIKPPDYLIEKANSILMPLENILNS